MYLLELHVKSKYVKFEDKIDKNLWGCKEKILP